MVHSLDEGGTFAPRLAPKSISCQTLGALLRETMGSHDRAASDGFLEGLKTSGSMKWISSRGIRPGFRRERSYSSRMIGRTEKRSSRRCSGQKKKLAGSGISCLVGWDKRSHGDGLGDCAD